MKNNLFLFAIVTLLSCHSQPGEKKYLVSGMVTQTVSYCGGAAPTQVELDELSKPRPLKGKLLFLKQGNVNDPDSKIITRIVTDEKGKFSLQLPEGNYCIVEEYKTKELVIPPSTSIAIYDETCLRDTYKKCDYSFTIKGSNISNITLNYHESCPWAKPCMDYSGPLPPAVQPPSDLPVPSH